MTEEAKLKPSIASANSVFEQPWWLDAVAPGRWSECVVNHGEELVARLPYVRRRRLGLETIVQPPLTQTLGPWLAPIAGKLVRRREAEKKVVNELIEQIPPFDHFRMNFSPAFTNWLPFYWAGFQATVRYTNRILDLTDLDKVQADFEDNVRRGIRKAAGVVEVVDNYPLEDLLKLDAKTYQRQGLGAPYPADLVRRLDAACAARDCRRIFASIDAQGRPHAALYVVWDERTFYAIINARDPELQAVGTNTVLYWEAIKLAAQVSKIFDFEGSMIEPIEHFFRSFGGVQTPYLTITRQGLKARSVLAARSTQESLRRLRRRGKS